MTDQPDEVGESWGLVMPFVVVASKGGPFDDDAYVNGYEAGSLDAVLATKPALHEVTVHTANLPQIDLVAMHRGYIIDRREGDEDWTWIRLMRLDIAEGVVV